MAKSAPKRTLSSTLMSTSVSLARTPVALGRHAIGAGAHHEDHALRLGPAAHLLHDRRVVAHAVHQQPRRDLVPPRSRLRGARGHNINRTGCSHVQKHADALASLSPMPHAAGRTMGCMEAAEGEMQGTEVFGITQQPLTMQGYLFGPTQTSTNIILNVNSM